MNPYIRQLLIPTLSVALFAAPALAHDPKEHDEASDKPDCAAVKDMDHSKMDMNDPVMLALQEKCKDMMGHGDHDSQGAEGTESNEDPGNEPSADPEKHEEHHE